MQQRGIDTLLLHSPANIYYLSGHYTLNLWDYQCLIVPSEGSPVMLIWHFEEGRFAATAVDTQPELFGGGADPIAETRAVLERRGWLGRTIGVEKDSGYLTPALCERLCEALEPAKTVNGSGLADRVRIVKSPAELGYIRRAGRVTDAAMRAGFSAIEEGVSDNEVAAAIVAELVRSGTQNFAIYPMVAAGARSGMPHNSHDGVPIERGKPVFLEFSPSIRWYQAPLMRAAIVGEPDARMRRLADVGAAALDAMCAQMRPGVPASTVAEAGRAVVDTIKDIIDFPLFVRLLGRHRLSPDLARKRRIRRRADQPCAASTRHGVSLPDDAAHQGRIRDRAEPDGDRYRRGAEVLSRLPLGLTRCGV